MVLFKDGADDSEVQLINEYQVPCVFMMNAGAHIRPELNYLFSDSEYGVIFAGKYLGQFRTMSLRL